jgi:hypothetical protein
MTAEGRVGELLTPTRAGGESTLPSVAAVLVACDRAMNEIGRRSHLFAWLRAPDAGAEEWLPVDAYYPGNRLVVVCGDDPDPYDHLYDELVPAHGLRLLRLRPADLGGDPADVAWRIERQIATLGLPPPRRVPAPATMPVARREDDGPSESVVSRALSALAQPSAPTEPPPRRVGQSQAAAAERAARFVAAHKAELVRSSQSAAARRPARRPPPAPRPRPAPAAGTPRPRPASQRRDQAAGAQTLGVMVGLALIGVLIVEIYFGVDRWAIAGGHVLLAFGLSLDACARALGTLAAERAGAPDWTWGCVFGGSPVVAGFALFQSTGSVKVEPAPLAGLISLLAIGLVTLAILGAAVGIG